MRTPGESGIGSEVYFRRLGGIGNRQFARAASCARDSITLRAPSRYYYTAVLMPKRARTAGHLTAALALAVCAHTSINCSSPRAPTTVSAEAWTRITNGHDTFLQQLEAFEEYPPGSSVVVVTGEGRRYIRVHGETKAGSGSAVTADSAFYIASMTKAYMGLLAEPR